MNKAVVHLALACVLLFKQTKAQPVEYTVPVVVHLIHNYGTEFLSDDAIVNALATWDSVFNALNPDTIDVIQPFKKYIGNAHIHFQLATRDPSGNPTKGITRHFSYLTNNAGDQSKIDQWPPNQYLNIWFARSLGQPHVNVAAYAYRPGQAALMPYYDGICALSYYANTGRQFEQSIGSYLDLKPVWGDAYPANVFCGDDGIDDTPPTRGHTAVGCTFSALYDTACATGYVVHYLNAQNLDSLVDYPDTANSQNIMDETYCSKMFTIGQCEHMRSVLNSNVALRDNLVSTSNLSSTGVLQARPDLPPVAEFSIEKGRVYSGIPPAERTYFACADNAALKFNFTDRSWGDTITATHWHFSNGATVTDTTFSPQSFLNLSNQFTQPGWVTVSLTSTGNNSGGTTFTDPQAVYAADGNNPIVEDPMTQPMHFMEFNPGQTAKWPIFNYYKNNFRWELSNNTGYFDNTCISYRAFDTRSFPDNTTGSPVGDYDDFFSEAYDLSAMQVGYCNLNFMSAGAGRISLSTDTLELSYSIDCGRSWISLKKIGGAELANNGVLSIAYTPLAPGEWKLNSIELPAAARSQKTFFRFRYRPGGDADGFSTGNNFYLDRISISNFPTGVNILLNGNDEVAFAPNPTHDDCYLVLGSGLQRNMMISVTDAMGREVYRSVQTTVDKTARIEIPSHTWTPGLYFATINGPNIRLTRKLIVCGK